MRDAFYQAAPKLKLVQLLSAGYDNVDLEAARRAKVPVSNNGGANAISVSEHALMLMLTVSRQVIWQHGSVSGGRWRGNGPAPRMYELYDKTLGIIGLGTIGKKVARLAPRVRHAGAVFRHRAADRGRRRTRSACDSVCCASCCARSDVISLHVPLNDSTRHMIGTDELALMKPDVDHHQHLARARDRRSCAAPRALRQKDVRRRPRRVRPGAAAARQSAVQARQRGAHARISPGPPGTTTSRASATRSTMCSASRAASRHYGSSPNLPKSGNRGTKIAGFCGFSVLLRPLTEC